MEKANESLKVYEEQVAKDMDAILNVKTSGSAVAKRLSKWEVPFEYNLIALILVFLFSIVAPCYGWFIMKTMNELNAAETKKGDYVGAI